MKILHITLLLCSLSLASSATIQVKVILDGYGILATVTFDPINPISALKTFI